MKIGVIGSMQYTEKMMAICQELTSLGHESYMSKFAAPFVGKSDEEKERIKLEQKYQQDAIREDCKWVKDMDAIVVANYDKHDIPNYIGGNAFIEMAYAHILGKPLYLLNPIPDMPYYGTEIIAMKPVVLKDNLQAISQADIHKAAGIIIKNRRLLVERSKGKDVFMAPGGKLEQGETSRQAAIRELKEEFQLTVKDSDLEEFGTFYAEAAGSHNAGKKLRMDVFMVKNAGEIVPDSEVEEIRWISSDIPADIAVGSIFAHEVLPRLVAQGLID